MKLKSSLEERKQGKMSHEAENNSWTIKKHFLLVTPSSLQRTLVILYLTTRSPSFPACSASKELGSSLCLRPKLHYHLSLVIMINNAVTG